MPSHQFDSSSAADRAAKKAGRFFSGKVYNTKAQAEAARKAKGSMGASKGRPAGGQAKLGPARSVEVVKVTFNFNMAKSVVFRSVDLLSSAAHVNLLALVPRHGKVIGARAEVNFPLTTHKARWVVATVHKLSAGDKTVEQVSKVKGAQIFDSADFVDKWLTLSDVSGVINPVDNAGNSLLKDTEHRNVVFACESTAPDATPVAGGVLTFHITVQVDAAGIAPVVDL